MTGAEAVAATLAWGYLLGLVVSVSVMRVRAGAGFWRGLRITGPDGFGVVWATTVVLCSMVWPLTLAIWLLRGRPEPRTVFNDKAVERRRREAAGGRA